MAFPRRQFLHGAAASLGLSALPRLPDSGRPAQRT